MGIGGLEIRRSGIVTDPLRIMLAASDTGLRSNMGSWIDRDPDCAVLLSRRDLAPALPDLSAFGIDLVIMDAADAAGDLEALGGLARNRPDLPVLMVYPDWPSGPIVTLFGEARDEAAVRHGPGALRFAVLSAIRRHSGRRQWRNDPPTRPSSFVPAHRATAPVFHA